jgi:predicted transcriptional regulator of viral defense system
MFVRMGAETSWDKLYAEAAVQAGYLTRAQAFAAGYNDPLLHYHVSRGHLERVARGTFRLVHFPPSDDEDLVVAWLWSSQQGVFSHETALRLHRLSDILPDEKHLTLPVAWKKRRMKIPRGLVLHYADLATNDVAWYGSVRITTPLRTLFDCEAEGVSPEFVEHAKRQAVLRGLVTAKELRLRKIRKRSKR